jgi:hypothetical protein
MMGSDIDKLKEEKLKLYTKIKEFEKEKKEIPN